MDFIVCLGWKMNSQSSCWISVVSSRKQHILERVWIKKNMRNWEMLLWQWDFVSSAFHCFKRWTREIKRCSAAGNNTDPLHKRIKKSAESTDWHIPLQSIYAVCHFAKATNAERDGCFQATGQQAPAACIQVESLLANHKLQFPL